MQGDQSPGRGSRREDGRSASIPPTPRGLTDAAKREWKRVVTLMDDRGLASEAWAGMAERYIDTVNRAEKVRVEWKQIGSPLLAEANNGSPYPHPLVTLLAATERDAARFAAQLDLGGKQEKRKPGGQVGAVYAPDRAAAPPKLKVLRDAG